MNRAFVRPLLVAVLLVAAGCADQPEKPSSTQIAQPEMPATPPDEPADEVERLLALAARGDGAAAREARLDAAAELVRRGDLARAATLLDELEAASLDSAQWIRHSLLRARLDTHMAHSEQLKLVCHRALVQNALQRQLLGEETSGALVALAERRGGSQHIDGPATRRTEVAFDHGEDEVELVAVAR